MSTYRYNKVKVFVLICISWLIVYFNGLDLLREPLFWNHEYNNRKISYSIAGRNSRSLVTEKKKKPVMYTFYMKQKEHLLNDRDSQEHIEMLRTWKHYWEEIGWETQVLTKEDAMRHPKFETYNDIINQLKVTTYDHYCFYRWLAMVTIGGGWMSDYDVIPLMPNLGDFFKFSRRQSEIEKIAAAHETIGEDDLWLPNNGRFTSFCSAVPCLMSGSAQEWDRVIDHIITQYAPKKKHRHFSDMEGLIKYATEESSSIFIENRVYPWVEMTSNEYDTKIIDCEKYRGQIAWHFSHSSEKAALDLSFIPSRIHHAQKYASRAWFIHYFMNRWKAYCLPTFK